MTDLSRLEEAISILEGKDEEYSLEDLASESSLDLQTVKKLIKENWIKTDQLEIFNIELSEAEESELYST